MRWVSKILQGRQRASEHTLQSAQSKFFSFLAILEKHNGVLKVISDMEEKAHGEYLFDINYIRSNLAEVRSGILEITDGMIAMGGDKYAPLRDRYREIDNDIARIFPESRPEERDSLTVPLERLAREKSWSVGSKSAQLGELKSKLNLPVPDGFAISARAYKHFVDANDLQARISDCISAVDIKHYNDLVRASDQIRSMVKSSRVPEDLADSIREMASKVKRDIGQDGFSLRSSAVGEDTLFSYAGQYATFLNVREVNLVDRYRDILASKFSPQAIYYYLSHSFTESDLAMGVCCIAMVDAKASGVIYTRDPVQPQNDCVVVYAIYGLGKYLVEGTLTPDVYCVSRQDGAVVGIDTVRKPVRLVLHADEGIVEEQVPEPEQTVPALSEEQARQLANIAQRIEDHYGSPMDIEWAIDHDGRPFLLQARPLGMVEATAPEVEPDVSKLEAICTGGTTVCPGAGCGPIFHLKTTRDLSRVPDGAVLVAPLPFPGLVTAMRKVDALVAPVGSMASHMATLAREFRLPTLVGLEKSCHLENGSHVTVDATGRVIYSGSHPELVEARRAEFRSVDEGGIYELLQRVLDRISPLNLQHPDDADFTAENCRTFHDITRFVHQRAMEEMFHLGTNIKKRDRIAFRLKSEMPLKLRIIYVDRDHVDHGGGRLISEDEIASVPMKALWDGIKEEGWPSQPAANGPKGLMSVMASSLATNTEGEFSESSFAVLSEEYMILSLRVGYHLATIEAMCTDTPSNNYIRFQCKGGGASVERRSRRIRVLGELLLHMGFQHTEKGDFLDARLAYEDATDILEKLRVLGRITMVTKQLDMALSNESITQWYIEDLKKRLGFTARKARRRALNEADHP